MAAFLLSYVGLSTLSPNTTLSSLPEDPHEPVLERLAARVDWEKRETRAGMRQTLDPTRDLLARPEVAYLHLRSASNNCYQCRIEPGQG